MCKLADHSELLVELAIRVAVDVIGASCAFGVLRDEAVISAPDDGQSCVDRVQLLGRELASQGTNVFFTEL